MRYFYQNLELILKQTAFLIVVFFICWNGAAQNLYLKMMGQTPDESHTIDSIGYPSKHADAKSVVTAANDLSQKLIKLGYLESEIQNNQKTNDSTFVFQIALGKRTNEIHIYIGNNLQLQFLRLFDGKKDTLIMPYREVEPFLNQTLSKIETKGFALAKLKLIQIKKRNDFLEATLSIKLNDQRRLDDLVISGYPKFPEGHKYNIKRLYKKKIFNQDNLKKLYTDFEKFRFIKQVKYPEILFANDSTKVYVYLEKTNASSFDGFIGFSNNDKQQLIFNGYVDLTLNNIVNTGETFTLYWKSDGNKQKTFNAAIALPYIFKTPFGLKAQLNIFKQDSTFQNTKTGIDLGYFFNYNSRLYLGYQATESSDIQNVNTTTISDFKNSFVTANFEFLDFKSDDYLFPENSKINMKVGVGSRNSKRNTNKQVFFSIDLKHNIYLNDKNSFNIKSENYYLQSNQYIINELYRFGGINSIRGFNENSLQANFFSSVLTEYRYRLSPNVYVHSIIDYGYYQDKTSDSKGNLVGLGFGFGLLTKTGLFNIIYANGSTKEQNVKLSNSIVHISFKTNF